MFSVCFLGVRIQGVGDSDSGVVIRIEGLGFGFQVVRHKEAHHEPAGRGGIRYCPGLYQGFYRSPRFQVVGFNDAHHEPGEAE